MKDGLTKDAATCLMRNSHHIHLTGVSHLKFISAEIQDKLNWVQACFGTAVLLLSWCHHIFSAKVKIAKPKWLTFQFTYGDVSWDQSPLELPLMLSLVSCWACPQQAWELALSGLPSPWNSSKAAGAWRSPLWARCSWQVCEFRNPYRSLRTRKEINGVSLGKCEYK